MAELKITGEEAFLQYPRQHEALLMKIDDRWGAFAVLCVILKRVIHVDKATLEARQEEAYIEDAEFTKERGMHLKRVRKVLTRMEELGVIAPYPGHGKRKYWIDYDVLERMLQEDQARVHSVPGR